MPPNFVIPSAPALSPASTLQHSLHARDFRPGPGPGEFRHADGLHFHTAAGWHVFSEPISAPHPSMPRELALWKRIRTVGGWERRFELPSWSVAESAGAGREDGDACGPAPWPAMIDWMLASRSGLTPAGWTPPSAALLATWTPAGSLTFQARGHARQATIHSRPGAWRLSVPLWSELAPDLPAGRRDALVALAAETESRWAMVRMGLAQPRGPESGTLPDLSMSGGEALVDLTGAPACAPLFSAGLDVLRHVVAWLVETVEVLSDPAVSITSLASARDGSHINPNQRRQP